MSYMTISSQENHHFSLCSYFHAHPTTLLLKILGGPMHGPSPTSNLGGRPPQSPLGLRLWPLSRAIKVLSDTWLILNGHKVCFRRCRVFSVRVCCVLYEFLRD